VRDRETVRDKDKYEIKDISDANIRLQTFPYYEYYNTTCECSEQYLSA